MEAESPLERNYVVRLHRYGKLIGHDCHLVNKLELSNKDSQSDQEQHNFFVGKWPPV